MWEISNEKRGVWPLYVLFDNCKLDFSMQDDDLIEIPCTTWTQFIELSSSNFPQNIQLSFQTGHLKNKFFGDLVTIENHDEKLKIIITSWLPHAHWNSKLNDSVLVSAIAKLAIYTEFELEELYQDKYEPLIVLSTFVQAEGDLSSKILTCLDELNSLANEAEQSLGQFEWKEIYETNEALFSKNVILPLLRRMNFLSVRYTHGRKEYGKDFTFSEVNPFGIERHYAAQIKAGDISGSVNSQIDEIIGQIDDAFSMPFLDLSSKEVKYISEFYVIISGNYTENAKEKIINKIPKRYIGSIFFLDRYKILELISRHWNQVSP